MARYLLSLVGQSNEAGAGPSGSARRVAGAGAPYLDSSLRSMWPSASENMAQRGHWLAVLNTAVGSTSLCDSWVGRCRTWATSMVVIRGSYVLSGGGFWRCNVTVGTAAASTVAPTGTTDTTGADSVPWVYVGAPASGDVDGAIYALGSARYDPNGYIAAAAVISARPGFDDRGVLVSIGQGDHSVGSTRSQYAQAMVNVATHLTGLGLRVWLGMSCYMAGTAARETTFQTVLLPGREDALTSLASNPLVKRGGDLRNGLGVLVAPSADNVVGLQSDELHLTSAGYEAAGLVYATAFQNGGW